MFFLAKQEGLEPQDPLEAWKSDYRYILVRIFQGLAHEPKFEDLVPTEEGAEHYVCSKTESGAFLCLTQQPYMELALVRLELWRSMEAFERNKKRPEHYGYLDDLLAHFKVGPECTGEGIDTTCWEMRFSVNFMHSGYNDPAQLGDVGRALQIAAELARTHKFIANQYRVKK